MDYHNRIVRELAICGGPAGLDQRPPFVALDELVDEPAQSARRLVEWFSARPPLGLHVFLIAMPLAAFAVGCATVLRLWRSDEELRKAAVKTLAAARAHLATLLVAGATLVTGCVLAIVALHVITD